MYNACSHIRVRNDWQGRRAEADPKTSRQRSAANLFRKTWNRAEMDTLDTLSAWWNSVMAATILPPSIFMDDGERSRAQMDEEEKNDRSEIGARDRPCRGTLMSCSMVEMRSGPRDHTGCLRAYLDSGMRMIHTIQPKYIAEAMNVLTGGCISYLVGKITHL